MYYMAFYLSFYVLLTSRLSFFLAKWSLTKLRYLPSKIRFDVKIPPYGHACLYSVTIINFVAPKVLDQIQACLIAF